MGCCAVNSSNSQLRLITDEISFFELGLSLHSVHIKTFHDALKQIPKKVLSRCCLGSSFKGWKFGNDLLSKEQTLAKRVTESAIFKNKSGKLQWERVYILGLLYCQATLSQKCEYMASVYATCAGIVPKKCLHMVVRIAIKTSVIVFPSLAYNWDVKMEKKLGVSPKLKEFISNTVEDLVDGEPWIHDDQIKRAVNRSARFLFNAAETRHSFKEFEESLTRASSIEEIARRKLSRDSK